MSERLSERDLDVIIEAAHPSRPDREELTRHHVERILAAHLADVEARLADWQEAAQKFCDDYHAELNVRIDVEARLTSVEALADRWERLADAADRGSFTKRERWTGALRPRAKEVRAALSGGLLQPTIRKSVGTSTVALDDPSEPA